MFIFLIIIFYSDIVDNIEKNINNYIEQNINIDIEDKLINNIYKFKNMIQYYLFFKKKFNYLNKDDFLNSILDNIKYKLQEIVTMSDIDTLTHFNNTFKEYLLKINDITISSYLTIGLLFLNVTDNEIIYNKKKVNLVQVGNLLESINNNSEDYNVIDILFTETNSSIFKKDFLVTQLVNIINYNVINGKKSDVYIKISKYIKNKDLFYKLMERKLMERLIYKTKNSKEKIDSEYLLVNKLARYHHNNNLLKYKTIINDFTHNSIIMNNDNDKKLYVMTENMWDINIHNGYGITSNDDDTLGTLSRYCNDFEKIYRYDHKVDKLLFHFDIGYTDITIKNNKGRIMVRMLPIQLICFENFSNERKYTKNELISQLKSKLVTYKDHFIENIIQSLVNSKLIVFTDNKYVENKDFNINGYNFINDFYKLNNIKNNVKKKF